MRRFNWLDFSLSFVAVVVAFAIGLAVSFGCTSPVSPTPTTQPGGLNQLQSAAVLFVQGLDVTGDLADTAIDLAGPLDPALASDVAAADAARADLNKLTPIAIASIEGDTTGVGNLTILTQIEADVQQMQATLSKSQTAQAKLKLLRSQTFTR